MNDYLTFTFRIDPSLNSGYTEAFKQGDEPWWWYTNSEEGPAAGPLPNFKGAVFMSLHNGTKQLL